MTQKINQTQSDESFGDISRYTIGNTHLIMIGWSEASHHADWVLQMLRRYEFLMPLWMRELRVVYDLVAEPAITASINFEKPYRFATMRIMPVLFAPDRDQRTREQNIIHELLHLSLAYGYESLRRSLDSVITDFNHRQDVRRHLNDIHEQEVQDLSFAIQRFVASVRLRVRDVSNDLTSDDSE